MKRLLMMALVLTMFSQLGCGKEDSDENNTTPDPTPDMAVSEPDMDTADQAAGPDMTYNPPATYAARYQLRFDTLVFGLPRKLAALNGVLRPNFDQAKMFPVIILVEIKDVDTTAGVMKLRGGAGVKTASAGVYDWDPDNVEQYFDGTLDPATGRVAGVIEDFRFVATFETEDPTMPLRSTLPINRLEFEGYLEPSPDGGGKAIIKIGKIDGNITVAEAEATDITIIAGNPPIKLSTLLDPDLADLDLDGDKIKDAWSIKNASFTAVAVTIR